MTDEPTLADALLPCPFCGDTHATTTYTRDGRLAVCTSCGSKSGNYYHGPANRPSADERAIAAWNTRAAPAGDKDATIARLTAERDKWRNDCLDANASELSLRKRAERAETKLAEVTAAVAPAADKDATIARLTRKLEWMKTKRDFWMGDCKFHEASAQQLRAKLAEVTAERDEWKDEYKTAEKGLNVYRKANVKVIAERDAARTEGFAQGIEAAADFVDGFAPFNRIEGIPDLIRALSPAPQADPVREAANLRARAQGYAELLREAEIELEVIYPGSGFAATIRHALAQKEPSHD